MFSNYQDESRLHEGNKHDVFRAIRTADGLPVVLKVLRRAFPSIDDIERFRVEYQTVAQVASPLVVKALGFEEDQHRWLLVQEDIGGRALADQLHTSDLTLRDRIEVAINLMQAVQAVHDQGVIHKDINPSNIVWNRADKKLQLIDFGISTQLTRETPAFSNRNLFEGSLAYIAPEQTGRVRAALDFRADLYSAGATLYELFVGQPPFETDDPLDLVYSHIAKRPAAPTQRRPDLPAPLNKIVLRLLEKRPEDRYQSAFAAQHDLQQCLDSLTPAGSVPDFVLGTLDFADRFRLPAQLFGREEDASRLVDALKVASSAAAQARCSQLVLVTGGAGMGKTALIQELYRPLTQRHGSFVTGKSDQYSSNPLASIAHALGELARQALSSSEAQLRTIVRSVRDALGPNGRVLTDLAPQVQLLIGEQAAVEDLPPTEQRNRQARVCRDFVHVFATPGHPVVLFLDDLQWADSATLELVEGLVTDARPGLLVIGAYRDTEVDHAHPLTAALARLSDDGAQLHTLELSPLSADHIHAMINQASAAPDPDVESLAQLVLRNTAGNPLWVSEYLNALADDGLLRFERGRGHWTWDLAEIERRGFTKSVLDLIVSRLSRMPADTLRALQVAACVGSQFELRAVAAVLDTSPRAVFDQLLPALNGGILVATSALDAMLTDPTSPTQQCSFFHDRIQQAAVGMLSADDLQNIHYDIGTYLLAHTPEDARKDKVFDIAGQLNRGRTLITQPADRLNLAQLNLTAGHRALAASAFGAAASYLEVGLDCLPKDPWDHHYTLCMSLHRELALACLMSGQPDRSETLSAVALEHAATVLEQTDVLTDRVYQHTTSAHYAEAIDAMRQGLELVGFPIPPDDQLGPLLGTLQAELMGRLGDSQPMDLLDQEPMVSETALAAVRLLAAGFAPGFYHGPLMYSVVILRAMNAFLEYGNPPASFGLYSCYGHLLSGVFGDRQRGYDFGRLGIELSDRHHSLKDKCLSVFITANFAASWVRPLAQQQALNQTGFQAGLEAGDLTYAGYVLAYLGHNAFYAGQSLDHIAEQMADHATFHNKIKNNIAMDGTDACRMVVENLRGRTETAHDFAIGELDEASFRARAQANGSALALCYLDIYKAEALFRYGDRAGALTAADAAEPLLGTIMNNHGVSRYTLFAALSLCDRPVDLDEQAHAARSSRRATLTQQLAGWAADCPENFAHAHALVRAETARLNGADSEAIEAFEDAMRLAEENGFPHDLALAQELAGRFWLTQRREALAQQYLSEAHYGYALWGARRKTEMLEAEWPALGDSPTPHRQSWSSTTTGTDSFGGLDLASVIKASQAISGEIKIERLLERLMTLVLETAGAQRGSLLINTSGHMRVQASGVLEARGDDQDLRVVVQQDQPLDSTDDLPQGIIGYAARTSTSLILSDATVDERFRRDPYVAGHELLSVLCMPLMNQGQPIGLLYLENHDIAGAFTEDRLSTLSLLAAQFTISFENAQLYEDMETKVRERTRELANKNGELEATLLDLRTTQDRLVHAEKMASLGQLTAGVAHEINNPLNFVNNFSTLGIELIEDADELVSAQGGDLKEQLGEILGDLRLNLAAISNHGGRAADIVSSMLLHARDDDGVVQSIDLNHLIHQYVDLAEFGLREARGDAVVDVILDLGPDLKPVQASGQDLGRVMVNLLNNAHDAVVTKSRQVAEVYPGWIRISTRQVGDTVQIQVSDNGGGVPDSLRKKVFDPFFTTKAGTAGTGLGLSLCYDIMVQHHGGNLELAPADGVGATFILSLPVQPPARA